MMISKDHPRVCGEQEFLICLKHLLLGSPPRVRGTANNIFSPLFTPRITPACAGNRIYISSRILRFRDHPRVCGEQCYFICAVIV